MSEIYIYYTRWPIWKLTKLKQSCDPSCVFGPENCPSRFFIGKFLERQVTMCRSVLFYEVSMWITLCMYIPTYIFSEFLILLYCQWCIIFYTILYYFFRQVQLVSLCPEGMPALSGSNNNGNCGKQSKQTEEDPKTEVSDGFGYDHYY